MVGEGASRLFQLAVLAAPAIVETVRDKPTVGLGLTGNAAANPWDSLAPGFRDVLAAVLAMGEAFALAQSAPGAGDSIIDARVYLFLYGSIVSPTYSHALVLLGQSLRRAAFSLPCRAALRQRGSSRNPPPPTQAFPVWHVGG